MEDFYIMKKRNKIVAFLLKRDFSRMVCIQN